MFVERLWRSVKYEEVYLRAYDSVGDGPRVASGGISISTIAVGRIRALTTSTPDQAYFSIQSMLPIRLAA